MGEPNKRSYYSELDGVRALAIILVFLFHLPGEFLQGGYIGVDLFIILSGYLILGRMNQDIGKGTFTVSGFLSSRVKRLLPALMFMVLTVWVVGVFIIPPSLKEGFLSNGVGALLSVENIQLWLLEGEYWAQESNANFFLHTWSLSLEEQFYLSVPLLWLLVHRVKKLQFPMVLLGLFVLSVILDAISFGGRGSAEFYLLPFRMWQFIGGGLAAIISISFFKHCGCKMDIAGGLALLLIGYCSLGEGEIWQSYPFLFRLLVSIAGVILIISVRHSTRLKQIFQWRGAVGVGKLSYSLYLWHWPVIVVSGFFFREGAVMWIVLITLALSLVSFYLVEKPIRYASYSAKKVFFYTYTVGVIVFGHTFFAEFKYKSDVFDGVISSRDYGKEFDYRKGAVSNGEVSDDTVLFMGSSMAIMYCTEAKQIAGRQKLELFSLAQNGHPLFKYDLMERPGNAKGMMSEFDRLGFKKVKYIVVADIWSELYENEDENFEMNLAAFLQEISGRAEQILIFEQVPVVDLSDTNSASLIQLILAFQASRTEFELNFDPAVVEANMKVRQVVESSGITNLTLVPVHKHLIKDDNRIRFLISGKASYADVRHLSKYGSRFVLEKIGFENLISNNEEAEE